MDLISKGSTSFCRNHLVKWHLINFYSVKKRRIDQSTVSKINYKAIVMPTKYLVGQMHVHQMLVNQRPVNQMAIDQMLVHQIPVD